MLISEFGFAPIGQGLFSCGAVGHFLDPQSFRWVYDCGTVSKRYHLWNAVDHLHRCWSGGALRPRIDLVAISHFDQDHVNGLETLLARFDVQRLLIPYLPLWQRVAAQSQQTRYQSHAARQLALDPVATIAAMPFRPREIVLVPGVQERPTEPPLAPDAVPPHSDPDLGELLIDYWQEDGQIPDPELRREAANPRGMLVRALRPGGRLWLANRWEFIPYNDATLAQVPTAAFLAQVNAARTSLLHATTRAQRKASLKRLIRAYDREFGDDAGPRNRISLFLYAGTICNPVKVLLAAQTVKNRCTSTTIAFGERAAVQYTGDGYLDNGARLHELAAHFGQQRLDAATCFQVMHHGAQGNWCPDVPAVIQPSFSVFSSDPSHKDRHPHAKVKRSFRDHHPLYTNLKSTAFFEIWAL